MTSPDPMTPSPSAIPPGSPLGRPVTDGPRFSAIIVGLVILAVGLWYFADRTLGLALPRLDADQLWPVAVIALGLWLIVRPQR